MKHVIRTALALLIIGLSIQPALAQPSLSCKLVDKIIFSPGYLLTVEITNNGTATSLGGWSVSLEFEHGITVDSSFNSQHSESGNTVTLSNVIWNANILPAQTWFFGFMGTHEGTFVEPTCTVVSP